MYKPQLNFTEDLWKLTENMFFFFFHLSSVIVRPVSLTNLEELDCSFNEIEALPSSVGLCIAMRTFAADHNFLAQLPPEVSVHIIAHLSICLSVCSNVLRQWLLLVSNVWLLALLSSQMGNWKHASVLFLHSNKLELLPEEMGEMQRLKVINLSNNK